MYDIINYILYILLSGIENFVNWLIMWTGIIDDKYQITVTTLDRIEYVINPKELI